jgi:GNAT superfamily N-acetyltransferase
MLQITRDVWDGHDYVPYVWNDWLGGDCGALQVATRGGEVVGFQHVSLLPDGSAWLEGIRVATGLQGGGIGSALASAGVEWARSMGCPAVRLATSSTNEASNRIAEKAGLRERARFQRAEATAEPRSGCERIALPFELERVWEWLRKAQIEFYTEGWTAHRLTADRLRFLLAVHAVAVVGSETSIDALAVATASERHSALRVGLVAGSPSSVTELGSWLRGRAHGAGLAAVRGPVNADESGLLALHGAGFDAEQKWSMILRELLLDS